MKTTSKTTFLLTALIAGLSFNSYAQSFVGGSSDNDMNDPANWGGTLPANSASPGIIDTVNASVESDNPPGPYDGLYITQTGASIYQANQGGNNEASFTNGEYNMNGGTWSTRRGLNVGSGQVFNIDGGDMDIAPSGGGGDGKLVFSSGGAFNLLSGSVTVTTDAVFNTGGVFTISGGTFDALGTYGNAGFHGSSGTNHFNGGTSTIGNLNFAGANGTINFGGSSAGSLSIGTVTRVNAFDWNSSSLMSLAISGADTSTYQSLWDNGDLLVDGAQSGTFSNNFQVSGSSISIIPEPSSFVLLGLAGLVALLLRRRR